MKPTWIFTSAHCYFSIQDLEIYLKENRKKDAERVLKGMKRWEWRGLEGELRKMELLKESNEMVEMEGTGVEASMSEKENEKKRSRRETRTYIHAHTHFYLVVLYPVNCAPVHSRHSWYIGRCSSYREIKGVSIVYEQYV